MKLEVREMTEPYDKEDQVDKALEERLDKLQEIFPKRNRKELLEVLSYESLLCHKLLYSLLKTAAAQCRFTSLIY